MKNTWTVAQVRTLLGNTRARLAGKPPEVLWVPPMTNAQVATFCALVDVVLAEVDRLQALVGDVK